MVTEKTLERINELYHKSKAEGLTDAELAEQKQLRADYVKAFRENLRGQLESCLLYTSPSPRDRG